MQLCYRGVRYEANPIALPTVESNTQARFLGKSYNVRRAAVDLEIPDKAGMVYRGVSDGKYTTGKFLGNTYSHPHVSIAHVSIAMVEI